MVRMCVGAIVRWGHQYAGATGLPTPGANNVATSHSVDPPSPHDRRHRREARESSGKLAPVTAHLARLGLNAFEQTNIWHPPERSSHERSNHTPNPQRYNKSKASTSVSRRASIQLLLLAIEHMEVTAQINRHDSVRTGLQHAFFAVENGTDEYVTPHEVHLCRDVAGN